MFAAIGDDCHVAQREWARENVKGLGMGFGRVKWLGEIDECSTAAIGEWQNGRNR